MMKRVIVLGMMAAVVAMGNAQPVRNNLLKGYKSGINLKREFIRAIRIRHASTLGMERTMQKPQKRKLPTGRRLANRFLTKDIKKGGRLSILPEMGK